MPRKTGGCSDSVSEQSPWKMPPLRNYLPLSFKTESEQKYIEFLWDAFESNCQEKDGGQVQHNQGQEIYVWGEL